MRGQCRASAGLMGLAHMSARRGSPPPDGVGAGRHAGNSGLVLLVLLVLSVPLVLQVIIISAVSTGGTRGTYGTDRASTCRADREGRKKIKSPGRPAQKNTPVLVAKTVCFLLKDR